ncbi:unnamed protein product [Thelazia callipaeda]|uniref:TIR domain-containing protein n=1 Tax=Thelazia callipaeda TaxID=103827 RepID=A0A0N5D984_THECL|nr:unnamed protein product [Thelazia callipaeda]
MALHQRSQSLPEDFLENSVHESTQSYPIPVKIYPQTISDNDNYLYESAVEAFVWDWPFSEDRIAKGFLSEEKFYVCLPFNQGGTGESRGTLKKFERISQSDFTCIVGLCNNGFFGTYFWRFEIEILRNLNILVLSASRDVSRPDETSKRLKRVRKVFKVPQHYDISTLTTKSYDWAVVIQANRRIKNIRGKKCSKLLQGNFFLNTQLV